MKKSFSFVLVSALAFSLLSVTAYAADHTLHVEYPESGEVHVEYPYPSPPDPDHLYDEEVISAEARPEDVPDAESSIPHIKDDSQVSVWYTPTEGNNNFTGFDFYLPSTEGQDDSWVLWEDGAPSISLDSNKWSFTMNNDVLVKAVFTAPTPIPSPEAIPQSNPAPSQSTPVGEPESYTPPTAEPESYTPPTAEPVVPKVLSETVTFGITKNGLTQNSQEGFRATVVSLPAKDLSNQNGLAAYYSALEGKEADILVTYGIYSSKDLSFEDNGKLTTLGWKNVTSKKLDKNAKIKAVCYNLIDGTYIIEGEIDEFGNVTLKDFIIRPTKTNITIYIER